MAKKIHNEAIDFIENLGWKPFKGNLGIYHHDAVKFKIYFGRSHGIRYGEKKTGSMSITLDRLKRLVTITSYDTITA